MYTTIKKTELGQEVLSWHNIEQATAYVMRNKRCEITIRPYEAKDALRIAGQEAIYGFRLAWDNAIDVRVDCANGIAIVRQWDGKEWKAPIAIPLMKKKNARPYILWAGSELLMKDREWVKMP